MRAKSAVIAIEAARILFNTFVTEYTFMEGGRWFSADILSDLETQTVRDFHALRFRNGMEWDVVNGFRGEDVRLAYETEIAKL